MRTVADWLGEYGRSHADPVNQRIHWICVPLIVLAVIGFLWSIPSPLTQVSPWLNWATVVALLALAYYAALSLALAIGMTVAFAMLFALLHALGGLPWPLWATSLAIFLGAWVGQFIGHAIEGKRPSFFRDIQFLLIGPLSLMASLYRRLGIPY